MGEPSTSQPRATIVVPAEVVQSLAMVTESLQAPVVLIGGWAVRCRLLMARSASRPTDDLDILLVTASRPARAALEAINAVQSDPSHPCRLDGLPLLVDVLADESPSGVAPGRPGRLDGRIEDPDGLNLLVPPFGGLLARSAEPMRLLATDEESETVVLLPLAGALLAAKAANVALEFRTAEKRASDGEDIVRLTEAFGTLALLADLAHATPDERVDLHHHLVQLGPGGISGQARASGLAHDVDRLRITVDQLAAGLA